MFKTPDRLRKETGLFALCCFLLFSSSGPALAASPAATPPQDVFSRAPRDRSLLHSQHFLVVDDFNTGKFLEHGRATWHVKAPAIGALDLAVDRDDGRNSLRGYSLRASFNLKARERASLKSFINKIDVSKAEYLVFKAKLKDKTGDGFQGRVFLTLRDHEHNKKTEEITKQLPPPDETWQDIILPISLFADLDLDQLIEISFTLNSDDQPALGTLWLDEIAFFNEGKVAFESHLDNLVAFPEKIFNDERRAELLAIKSDKKFLKEIARDTWKYFVNARDKDTHLVVDHLRMGEAPLIADYTSLTNIAMDILSTIAALDLDFIGREAALRRVRSIVDSLKAVPKYNGFFYNFYDTKKLSISRKYLSTVDNGWLAISLVVARDEFKEVRDDATALLDGMDFSEFLDPENNQLVVGLDVPVRNFGQYHYGLLVTEARATSLYAIGKGDISRDHWWFIYRTLPDVWRWQNQKPKGHHVIHDGIEYFQGYYEKDGKKFVPSWGGSLFEVLMPTLVLRENHFAKKGLGLNNRIQTELQRDYALKEKGYPVWGISPCAVSSGRKWTYREYGVKALGAKGYPDDGVVTPHVSFLALDSLPGDAIKNIRKLLAYQLYGEYGFYDSLDIHSEKANPQYLALDQGMSLVAICNYLKKGAIQKRFHHDPVGSSIEDLLKDESFFTDK